MKRSWNIWLGLVASLASMMVAPVSAQQPKPNILVIMGDDIARHYGHDNGKKVIVKHMPANRTVRTKTSS
jgi:hypothetical protein